ncbi:MAG TPA: 2Fe-2S iron-sulfur cluster binding domain-containing protein [Polyangia bacterium]|jgi:toluene monooxygenase electron transfer component|nr:2Fe-2S iron-sulfur cluster binding domain-containing protein [Polyangia bacterium]
MRVTFETNEGSQTVAARPGEKILRAALRGGLPLPYDCATGTCGACKARLLAGRADSGWGDAPGARRCGPGELLTCQAVALGACTLRVDRLRPSAAGTTRPAGVPGRLQRPRRLTHDVVSFDVDLSRPLPFAAGQFVLLEAPHITGARAYSIAGARRDGRTVSFVAKRKDGGRFGDWLFGEAPDDAPVTVFGPLGRAVFDGRARRHLLCVAGGTGVAGMLSILQRASEEGHLERFDAHLYFGVRTVRDVFLLDELAAIRARHPARVAVTIALSAEEPSAVRAFCHPGVEVTAGLVHDVMRERMAGRLTNCRAYVAGPRAMVDASLRALIGPGWLPPGEIRFDRFD